MKILDKSIYVVNGLRTAIGSYGGSLSSVRPDDLIAKIIKRLMLSNLEIEDSMIEEVVLGCANQSGEDNRNIARMAILLSGLDEKTPGITVNRLCASGLDAVIYAYCRIKSGLSDLIIAGGVESMSRAPYVMPKPDIAFKTKPEIYDTTLGWRLINKKIEESYGCDPLGTTAENVASQYKISRNEQDEFALSSQQKAKLAIDNKLFVKEISPISVVVKKVPIDFSVDEFPRESSIKELNALKPAFLPNGTVTAGNSSGLNDGAAALIIASGKKIKELGLYPLAEILDSAVTGVLPSLMGLGPISSTARLFSRLNLKFKDIDVIELNEAFAAQALACLKTWNIGIDDKRVNPNGGAIALGHPLGMSGARLVLTAALQLRERGGSKALITMCVGVGQGVSLVIKSI